ncbi:hypothetical protein DPMN_094621 [Dreissena polymorpha]|uniref:Uncharacterized protein n=1 Tax=Dreissena polymorpha TaxID=45954 RepID=A0A9D4L6G4_DREPO|nr:hypothetical protein DPMN_094621 [Dreissena polymorpha]
MMLWDQFLYQPKAGDKANYLPELVWIGCLGQFTGFITFRNYPNLAGVTNAVPYSLKYCDSAQSVL